jgi:hypothetical protein
MRELPLPRSHHASEGWLGSPPRTASPPVHRTQKSKLVSGGRDERHCTRRGTCSAHRLCYFCYSHDQLRRGALARAVLHKARIEATRLFARQRVAQVRVSLEPQHWIDSTHVITPGPSPMLKPGLDLAVLQLCEWNGAPLAQPVNTIQWHRPGKPAGALPLGRTTPEPHLVDGDELILLGYGQGQGMGRR